MNRRKFAVFDIDGTLLRWQLYHATANQLAKEGVLGPDAYSKIKSARTKWKERENQESFSEYQNTVIVVFNEALQGMNVDVYNSAVDKIIEIHKNQTYVYTKRMISSLKSKGFFLLAISGSHKYGVEQVCKYYGFDDWIGSKYQTENGKFTGEIRIASINKREELTSLVKKHDLSYKGSWGFGDSASDIDILRMVDNPVAFNPDSQLMNMAKSEKWNIVIERKNVIYKLKEKNGSYLLA